MACPVKFWTDERIQQIRDMAEAGKKAAEIAQYFGKSESVVRSYASKNKIPLSRKTLTFTEDDDAFIREMFEQGHGWRAIADAMGKNAATVSTHAREKLGLRIKAEEKKQTTPRRCLMCGDDFPSEWAGERVCGSCKGTAAWRSGENDYSVRA